MNKPLIMRSNLVIIPLVCLALASETSRGQSPSTKQSASSPLQLNGDLLRTGLQLLPKLPPMNVNIISPIQLGLINVSTPLHLHLCPELKGLVEEQRRQNELLAESNKLRKEGNDLLADSNRLHKESLGYQRRILEYEKTKHESVLRKETYDIPGDKLVVVVADFSSGNPADGCEVADEIAIQLAELRKHGVDMHILVGEIKLGVVIRSEEMAEDVGKHFPPGTDYVVIWGTMSPRTVGKYRPHITSVQKTKDNQAWSVSFTIDLDPQELPIPKDEQSYSRACYERLIGASSAAIPSCYVAHEISRERVPDLTQLLDFLGMQNPEAKKLSEEHRLLSQWAVLRGKNQLSHFQRVSTISFETPYPALIFNQRDDSMMVLIADKKGRPVKFKNKSTGKEEIVYIDVSEATNRQYADFLNARGDNKFDGGVPWLNLHGVNSELVQNPDTKRFVVAENWRTPGFGKDCPVVQVSWFGAKAYCEWSGKALPTQEEWRKAAEPRDDGNHPWGKESWNPKSPQCKGIGADRYYTRVGHYEKDKSRIGCFDMSGNVSEWCSEWSDENKGQRVVCGGSFADDKPERFQIDAVWPVDQVTHSSWVGFRGVVRIPVN